MEWEALCEVLLKQLNVLKYLLELYEYERVALCRFDIAMLEESVERKNTVLNEFNKLEQNRVELCKKNNLDKMTLKELSKIAPKEYAEKLLELRNSLKKIAEELESKRMRNNSLILNAQIQTELLINIIRSAGVETYTQKGKIINSALSTMNQTI